MKNPFGKTVKKENAYAVYTDTRLGGWVWYVLKTYQTPEKAKSNPYARAFCLVVSPMVGERGELGDVYLNDIGDTLVNGQDVKGDRKYAVGMAELEAITDDIPEFRYRGQI
jgi:hypothetical protein